jgi:hypothetical protein
MEMPSLLFENHSSNVVTACLYQTMSDLPAGAGPVAWRTAVTQIGGFWRTDWTPTFNFVWSQVQTHPDGGTSTTGQVVSAGSGAGSTVPLTYADGSLVFGPVGNSAAGKLVVDQDGLVRRGGSVGIGMQGSATFLAPTQPNLLLAFNMTSRFWITLGDYRRGTPIDVATARPVRELVFDSGTDGLYLELLTNNTFSEPVPIASATTAFLRYQATLTVSIDE